MRRRSRRAVASLAAAVALGFTAAVPSADVGRQVGATSGLSPVAVTKVEWLLQNRLPCLGCHSLGGTGGRIGPSLDGAGGRLTRDEIEAVVADPRRARPGSLMPRVAMPASTRELLVQYLADLSTGSPATGTPPVAPTVAIGATDSATLYRNACAPCHGDGGDGDGYNAQYLPTRPTAHSSAAYMSTRPDDVLFDGIAAGGYVLDRSPFMPDYGGTLSPAEIRALVGYLRVLCACEGPAWSRDDR